MSNIIEVDLFGRHFYNLSTGFYAHNYQGWWKTKKNGKEEIIKILDILIHGAIFYNPEPYRKLKEVIENAA